VQARIFSLASRMASASARGILGSGSQQEKRQALGGFLANTGEMLQFIDESFDGSGKIRHAACVA